MEIRPFFAEIVGIFCPDLVGGVEGVQSAVKINVELDDVIGW